MDNLGNSGNFGNFGNQGNQGNPGGSGNYGNTGNYGNQGNPGNINLEEENEFMEKDIMAAVKLLKEEGNRNFEKGKYDLAFASYHSCLASVDQMKVRPKQYDNNEVLELECILFGNIANTLCIMSGSDDKIQKDKADYYKAGNKYPSEMNYFFDIFNKYSSTNSFIQLLGGNLFITRALKRNPHNLKYLIWRIQILRKLNLETMFKYVLEIIKHKECDKDIYTNMRNIIIDKIKTIKDWKTIEMIVSDEIVRKYDHELLNVAGEFLLTFYDLTKIKNKKLLEERKELKRKFVDQSGAKNIANSLIETKNEKLVNLADKLLAINLSDINYNIITTTKTTIPVEKTVKVEEVNKNIDLKDIRKEFKNITEKIGNLNVNDEKDNDMKD